MCVKDVCKAGRCENVRESDQESRSLSLKVCAASEADFEAEACADAAFKLAIREFRRTLAMSLSLDVGCGTGIPRSSSHAFRSRKISFVKIRNIGRNVPDSDQVEYSQFPG